MKPLEKISGKHSRTEGAQRTPVRASSAQLQNDGVNPDVSRLATFPLPLCGINTATAAPTPLPLSAGPTLLPLPLPPCINIAAANCAQKLAPNKIARRVVWGFAVH